MSPYMTGEVVLHDLKHLSLVNFTEAWKKIKHKGRAEGRHYTPTTEHTTHTTISLLLTDIPTLTTSHWACILGHIALGSCLKAHMCTHGMIQETHFLTSQWSLPDLTVSLRDVCVHQLHYKLHWKVLAVCKTQLRAYISPNTMQF